MRVWAWDGAHDMVYGSALDRLGVTIAFESRPTFWHDWLRHISTALQLIFACSTVSF
jgi:hypothetical protein